MQEIKNFPGILNTDSAVAEVLPNEHIDARNVVFRDGRIQNLYGTTLISNSHLPNTGTNRRHGDFYDSVRQRIYWFNYNSGGKHGAYSYDIQAATVTPIFICLTNSIDDILQFDLDQPIASINIVYGDDDVMYFLDSLKRPTKLNITQYLATPPTGVTREDINVLKNPPTRPPAIGYSDDVTVTVNNLRKNLFQFRYRFVHSINDKSVWSSVSKLPLPTGQLNPDNDTDPTKNCKLLLTLQTGSSDVKKIEVAVRKSIGSQYDKFQLVTTLDKAALVISDNTTYVYSFFNDAAYPYIDERESNLLFDYIPDEANAQELLNGNVIIYGGIEEGLSRDIDIDIDIASVASTHSASTSSVAAWAYNSRFGIGLVYYKDAGKTNGVFVDMTAKLQTSAYSESGGSTQVPKVNLTINHRPFIWANYFQWVRTENSTKSSILQFISNATFKDDKFAYISKQSLDLYISENPSTAQVLQPEFTGGDRITFYKRINTGASSNIYTDRDYEIVGMVTDPLIDSTVRIGNFVKIILPSNLTATFDFGVVSSVSFNNYYVELYTPTKPAADGSLSPYFEFGECYGIGDAGLSTRYHFGQTQSQTSNLSQPALFSFLDGDVYTRIRQLGIGNIMNYTLAGDYHDSNHAFLGVTFNDESYNDAGYDPQSQTNAYVPATTFLAEALYGNNFILEIFGAAKTFKIHVTISFTCNNDNTVVYVFLSMGIYGSTELETGTTPRVYLFDPTRQTFNAGSHTVKCEVIFTVNANTKVYLLHALNLGTSITYSPIDFYIQEQVLYTQYFEDRNFSDFYVSTVNSNGRPLSIDENARDTYNPTLRRFSMPYVQGTNINGLNRFYPDNFNEVNRDRGDIQRFNVLGNELRTFQNRGVCRDGVYSKFITQTDGTTSLATTNEILTPNNFFYYKGNYGIGDQYTGLVCSATDVYFVDPTHGQCRLSENGIDPISELWKGQFYIRGLLTPYNKTWSRSDGGTARIMGYFDYFENQYICLLQGGTLNGVTMPNYAFAFKERGQGNPSYTAFYDYIVDGMVCAEEITYSWKDGQFYIHNNTNDYNKFHGTQYDAYITLPFNKDLFEKKLYQSIAQQGSEAWDSPEIYTDTESYAGQRQETSMVASDYRSSTGKFQAALKRDIHSAGTSPLINGNKLKGSLIVVKFRVASASNFVFLTLAEVRYDPQPLTPR